MRSFAKLFFAFSFLLSCAGNSSESIPNPDEFREVLRYWDLLPNKVLQFEVSFRLLDDWLAVYKFQPPQPQQWVIFTHGILDHIGTSSVMIRFFLSRHVGVVAFDLPGHGLSRGSRAHIDDFSVYGDAWARVMRFTQDLYPRTAISHSTGSAAYLTFTQRDGSILPERSIMIAPLVRNVFWDLSRFAYSAVGWATRYVPANDNAATRDQDWLNMWRKDPITVKLLPLTWFEALQRWEERSGQWKKIEASNFHIIQGTADGVVDWRYNIPFLEGIYLGINVHYVVGGWHGLQYEIPEVKQQFYHLLENIMEIK